MRTLGLALLAPALPTLAFLTLTLSGCSMIMRPRYSSNDDAALERSPVSPPPATAARSQPEKAALPAVSKDAAHPTVAWFVAKTGEVPGLALGGLGTAAVKPEVVQSFIMERALADIAPACLRNYQLKKTAAKLEKVPAIRDEASLDSARKLIAEIMPTSDSEVKAMKSYSDQANGHDAAEHINEVLQRLASQPVFSGQEGALDVAALRPWAALLDVCFDKDRPPIVERNLGQFVSLLKSGKPPARNSRAQGRFVHPGVATFLRLAGGQVSVEEFSGLLAVDAGDTLRGNNLEVTMFAADIAVRELSPRVLEACGAKEEASKLTHLAPIRNAASLDKALNVLGGMNSQEGPNRFCIGAAQNLASSVTSEALDSVSYQKSGINSHPYYARGAFAGWLHYRSTLRDLKVPDAEIERLTQDLLVRAVKKLRQLPRRKETTREPA